MNLRNWRQRLLTLTGSLLLAACGTVAAPEARATQEEPAADPPARVGRLSALKGEVQVAAEPQGAWEPAQLNWPLTTQSMLFVPPGGLTEARIGSSAVRLDGDTQAAFAQLDDHAIAIDLIQGTVRARVRTLFSGDQFSVAADGVRAEVMQPGDYRASFDPDRSAFTLAVLSGRLRVVTPSNTLELAPGQQAEVGRGGSTLMLAQIDAETEFDRWAQARDRAQDRIASSRYVSPELTGIESLDEHGIWQVDRSYGNVWFPNVVAPGWAPYRHGRWVWVRPWGWSWVDDSPWGYAPFHYGRWSQFGGRWGWVPGPQVARPVWTPAQVGFVGGPPHGYPNRPPGAWFPLAPTEVYVPWHRYSPRYEQRFNQGPVNVIAPPADGDRRARRHAGPEQPAPAYRYSQRPDALTTMGDELMRDRRTVGPMRPPITAPVAPDRHADPAARSVTTAQCSSRPGLALAPAADHAGPRRHRGTADAGSSAAPGAPAAAGSCRPDAEAAATSPGAATAAQAGDAHRAGAGRTPAAGRGPTARAAGRSRAAGASAPARPRQGSQRRQARPASTGALRRRPLSPSGQRASPAVAERRTGVPVSRMRQRTKRAPTLPRDTHHAVSALRNPARAAQPVFRVRERDRQALQPPAVALCPGSRRAAPGGRLRPDAPAGQGLREARVRHHRHRGRRHRGRRAGADGHREAVLPAAALQALHRRRAPCSTTCKDPARRCWWWRRCRATTRRCCATPCARCCSDHKVYITDWIDARMVPLEAGPFHLDDYVALRAGVHPPHRRRRCNVISVCQPTVPVLAAVSLMATAGEPTPRTMTMMGGPIDARQSPDRRSTTWR